MSRRHFHFFPSSAWTVPPQPRRQICHRRWATCPILPLQGAPRCGKPVWHLHLPSRWPEGSHHVPLPATTAGLPSTASSELPSSIAPRRWATGLPLKLIEPAALLLVASSDWAPSLDITTPSPLIVDALPVRYGGRGPLLGLPEPPLHPVPNLVTSGESGCPAVRTLPRSLAATVAVCRPAFGWAMRACWAG
jgi:hypothetical protein